MSTNTPRTGQGLQEIIWSAPTSRRDVEADKPREVVTILTYDKTLAVTILQVIGSHALVSAAVVGRRGQWRKGDASQATFLPRLRHAGSVGEPLIEPRETVPLATGSMGGVQQPLSLHCATSRRRREFPEIPPSSSLRDITARGLNCHATIPITPGGVNLGYALDSPPSAYLARLNLVVDKCRS